MNAPIHDDYDLTAEDQAAYDELQDPDDYSNRPQEHFPLDTDLQRMILAGLLRDRTFLLQYSGMLKSKYFTNVIHQRIAAAILDYFREFKGIPTKTILMAEVIKRIPEKEQEDTLLHKTEVGLALNNQEYDVAGRVYLGDQIYGFAVNQALKESILKTADALKKRPSPKQNIEIRDALIKAVTLVETTGNGLNYFATLRERLRRTDEENDDMVFTTGIPDLDASYSAGGMIRKGAYAIAAPSGDGKSVFLASLARANLVQGRKVLFISCELSEDEIAQRFDSMLSGTDIRYLQDRAEDIIPIIEGTVSGEELLWIKQYAPKTLDANGVQAYIDQLRLEGFVPDLVLVDYIGEMKIRTGAGIPKHEAMADLSTELKGLAVSNNLCLVTAIQVNRDGKRAVNEGALIDDAHLADSYGQIRPLDGCWTINRSDDERAARTLRIGVVKARSGSKGGIYHLEEDGLLFRSVAKQAYYAKMQTNKKRTTEDDLDEVFTRNGR